MVVQNQAKTVKNKTGGGLAKSFSSCHNELRQIGQDDIDMAVIGDENMMGRTQIKIIRKNTERGKRNQVNSNHTKSLPIREDNMDYDDIGNTNRVGQGQDNTVRRKTGGGTINHATVTHNESLGVGERITNMDDIGSNTNSPAYEENACNDEVEPLNNQGGNKRKYANKLASRLQTVLNANEAAYPTHNEGSVADENPPRKVRTKYFYENRRTRDEAQHNDQNSSQASATSAKRKKGQRGKYKSLALEKKTMGGQFKLDVEIPDYVLQIVGENARFLVNFCGYVVRTIAPMEASDWPNFFAKYGQSMWLQVKNKFNIKDSCTQLFRLEAFATDVMQRLYRSWKARLHSYYKECGNTYEERLAKPPVDFPDANWKACCDVFNSDKFKDRSARNSKNRKSDKWCKHTTGNLSFPEVEHMLTKQNDGVLPPADVVWMAEHTRTNGQGVLEWVNDNRSNEIHKQLHQLVQDKDKEPEGDEIRPQTQEDMLLHVLGPRSGYTRGKGSGYKGSAKSRLQQEQQQNLRKQQIQITQLQSELEGSQNHITQLQSELDASRKQMEEYKAQQACTMADMEKRLTQMIKNNRRELYDDDADDDDLDLE